MSLDFLVTNSVYLWPYALLLVLFFLVSLQGEITRFRGFEGALLCVPLFFAGFRGAMTPDLERYRDMYRDVGSGLDVLIEPTFIWVSRLLHFLGLDYHALFFVYTLATLAFIYLGVKEFTSQHKFSLLLYVLIPACFLNLFVEMRGTCGVAMCLYATGILRNRSKSHWLLKGLLLAAASVLVHYPSIVYWACYFPFAGFLRRRRSLLLCSGLLIGTLLVPTSAIVLLLHATMYPVLPEHYRNYLDLFLWLQTSAGGFGQILKSGIYTMVAFVFVFWASSREENDADHLPVNLFVIGVALLNITRGFPEISRVAYPFLIFQIVLWPLIISKIRQRMWAFSGGYAVFLFYLSQFMWGLYYYSEEADSYIYLHYTNSVFSLLH